jgi:hypothetical protein
MGSPGGCVAGKQEATEAGIEDRPALAPAAVQAFNACLFALVRPIRTPSP